MFRIISIIFFLSFLLYSPLAFASGAMTDSSFMIDLGQMDPLREWDNISWQWGVSVLLTLLGNLSDLFLFIIPIIAAVSFLAAGYFYIFSAGDSEKVGRAKTIIKWNIVAILVALLSYGIISLVALLFT